MNDLQVLRALKQNSTEWRQELESIKESVSQTASQGLENLTSDLRDYVLQKLEKTTDDLSEAVSEIKNLKSELTETILAEFKNNKSLQLEASKTYKTRLYKALSQALEYINKEQAWIVVVGVVCLAAGYILCKTIS